MPSLETRKSFPKVSVSTLFSASWYSFMNIVVGFKITGGYPKVIVIPDGSDKSRSNTFLFIHLREAGAGFVIHQHFSDFISIPTGVFLLPLPFAFNVQSP